MALLPVIGIRNDRIRSITNMSGRINNPIGTAGVYANGADYCNAFLSNMDRLYLLAYLLTACHERAERCFVAGFDECIDGISVFSEWVPAWVRTAIVKCAIRMIAPGPGAGARKPTSDHYRTMRSSGGNELLSSVVRLEPFERCVFVMSVLERLSDQECSILLRTTRGEVATARRMAVEHLASAQSAVHCGKDQVSRYWDEGRELQG